MRKVGKKEEADDGDDKRNGSLKDEQPPPSRDATNVAEAVEDSCCDQAGKGGCEDVSGVENGDAGCDFFAGVEGGEEVDSTGVVRRFCDTEEEAC